MSPPTADAKASAQGLGPDTVFRGGDGRAALESMSGYIISEAMHALGIHPQLAVVTTGEQISPKPRCGGDPHPRGGRPPRRRV
jgi:uncharacterized protein YdiU (UPF0061 family)